ncbi:MAG: hypothetical protein ACR2QG_03260 [Gammaproteobacteria bacterium]
MSYVRAILALGVLATLAACTTYYEVKDPTTDKVYYTKDLDIDKGVATLTDSNTGAQVTIQNSEVKEVSKDTYRENVPVGD